MWLRDLIRPNISLIVQYFGYKNHLFLVLTQLKLGLMNWDLAIRFNINEAKVSKIFRKRIKALSVLLKNLIVWPDREAVRKNLPSSSSSFKNCVCIIDCTKIFIEQPQHQLARAQVHSNYKSHNTVKYLIGVTPAGGISFLSYGWGGHASEKMIKSNSDFLEMVLHGDCILADRSFLIEEGLAVREAVLII